MKQRDELSSPNSCINKAEPDEWVFVLKSTDRHAPALVQLWATIRKLEGRTDPAKVTEAFDCAEHMREWREARPLSPSMDLADIVLPIAEMILRARNISEIAFLTSETIDPLYGRTRATKTQLTLEDDKIQRVCATKSSLLYAYLAHATEHIDWSTSPDENDIMRDLQIGVDRARENAKK